MSATEVKEAAASEKPKVYGHTVFFTAAARYWRAVWVFLAVIVVNAILQAILILPDGDLPGLNALFIIKAILSYLVMVWALSIMVSAALQTPNGKVSFGAAIKGSRANIGKFFGWTLLWTVVCVVLMMFYVVPGLIAMMVLPFVIFAASDGQSNPFKANFQAIGNRFGRYLITLLVTLVFLSGLYVFAGLSAFVYPYFFASLWMWFICGIVGSWLITGWALLYRSTKVGAAPVAAESTTDTSGEPAAS